MENECSICFERVANCTLVCKHKFCISCVKKWYMKGSTCPMCRRNLHFRRMPVNKWKEEAEEASKETVFQESFDLLVEEIMQPMKLYIDDIIEPIVIHRRNVSVIDLVDLESTYKAIKDSVDPDELDYVLNETDYYFSSRRNKIFYDEKYKPRDIQKRNPKSFQKKPRVL